MPGCIVSATTASFCSVVKRRRRATPLITSTFEKVSDIGVSLGLCLGPPAKAGVRSKRGALHPATPFPSTYILETLASVWMTEHAHARGDLGEILERPAA